MGFFVGVDLGGVLEGGVDVVEALEQNFLARRGNFEFEDQAVLVPLVLALFGGAPDMGRRPALRANTRRAEKDGPEPQEKTSLDDCIRAYTSGSAYAEFRVGEERRTERGRVRRFILLSNDLTEVPPAPFTKTRVLRSVVGTLYPQFIKIIDIASRSAYFPTT